ncbi:MAG: glutamine synthetase family protein [Pseudomonadota bacterium]
MPADTSNLGDAAFNRVRVLFADQLNLARGKYVPLDFAKSGVVRLCVGAYAVTYQRDLIDAPGSGVSEGLPDLEAMFDPEDLRPGWEPNTRIALASLESGGEPSGLCGRSALKRAIAQWQELGLNPKIGFEGEAYIFERDDKGAWVPYDAPGGFVYGTGPFTDPAGLIDDIWEMAFKCGLPVESFNAEYDASQFELTLEYADALKACDDIFLFRTMARELLYKRGYLLSFMPKPIADRGGSGLHMNLSFGDAAGKNAMDGGTQEGALSELVGGCIAGLLQHHEGLGGLVAPTVNSYDRLKPAQMCGYWANWGFDHRAVAVRISGETGSASRIEHRVGDCAASPYVAATGLLQAARLGYTKGYELPPPEKADGFEVVSTTRGLAENLGASLDALEQDTELVDAVGRLLVENYIAIKRAEINEVDGLSEAEVFDYYAPFI